MGYFVFSMKLLLFLRYIHLKSALSSMKHSIENAGLGNYCNIWLSHTLVRKTHHSSLFFPRLRGTFLLQSQCVLQILACPSLTGSTFSSLVVHKTMVCLTAMVSYSIKYPWKDGAKKVIPSQCCPCHQASYLVHSKSSSFGKIK